MKKTLCMLIVLAMVLCLVPFAMADGDDFDPSEIMLTYACPIVNHPVLRATELGFAEACEDLGYQWQVVGPESADYNEVCAAAEAAAAAGSTNLVIWVGDEVAANGANLLKNDYDAVVACPHTYWEEGTVPGVALCRACDSATYGAQVADFIAERIEGKTGSIAITQGTFTPNEDAAVAAFIARIDELKEEGKVDEGVTVLDPILEGVEDITDSTNVNVSVIQANPDLIAAFSSTGAGPVTWSNAARKCDKQPGDLVIVSMDYTADNLAEIEAGYCTAIVAQPLYDETYKCVEALDKILRGEADEVEYWEEIDAPLVYNGGEGVHDPATYAGILDRVSETFG